MNCRRKLLAAAGALVASVAAGIGTSPLKAQELPPLLLEQLHGSPSRIRSHLDPASPSPTDENRRTDVIEPGDVTSYLIHGDRSTEDIHYYPKSDTKRASEDYFATKADGSRQMHGQATFEADGQTYKSHEVYRFDSGFLERKGERFRDGRYQHSYMFEDGFTPERVRIFDAALQYFTETIYKWNAAHTETYVYAKIVRGDMIGQYVGQYWVSLYREGGNRFATLNEAYGLESGQLFAEDGSTMLAQWGEDAFHSYYLTYTPGSDVPTQDWETVTGRTKLTVYNPETHLVVRQQFWQERPEPTAPGGKRYLLMNAAQFDANQNLISKVEMSGNGSHAVSVSTLGNDGDVVVKKLDATGKRVIETERQAAPGKTPVSSEPLQSADKSGVGTAAGEELVEIDPKLLMLPDRPSLPTFNDLGPQRIYDYP
jgi:hypothetical protein